MSEHIHSHKKLYFIVFAALTILTALELWLPELNIAYSWKAWGLTILACVKAYLVGYYFMHLNEETWWLRFIALIPISAAFYALVVILESTHR